jgi:hypothetical protein
MSSYFEWGVHPRCTQSPKTTIKTLLWVSQKDATSGKRQGVRKIAPDDVSQRSYYFLDLMEFPSIRG